MKEKALKFIENKIYCVIATINENGQPESAYVGFSVNSDLDIMIGTSKKSRKFQNILRNPKVSIVFWEETKETLQYEGTARPLEGEELKRRSDKHYKKNPGAIKYKSNPDNTYFIVEPTWIRLTKSGPVVLGEMRFDSR